MTALARVDGDEVSWRCGRLKWHQNRDGKIAQQGFDGQCVRDAMVHDPPGQ